MVFAVFTLAFVALAVAIVAQHGPWYLSAAYLVSGGVTGMLAWRSRPTQAAIPTPPTSGEQARRARRSGNPAVRSQAPQRDAHRD